MSCILIRVQVTSVGYNEHLQALGPDTNVYTTPDGVTKVGARISFRTMVVCPTSAPPHARTLSCPPLGFRAQGLAASGVQRAAVTGSNGGARGVSAMSVVQRAAVIESNGRRRLGQRCQGDGTSGGGGDWRREAGWTGQPCWGMELGQQHGLVGGGQVEELGLGIKWMEMGRLF